MNESSEEGDQSQRKNKALTQLANYVDLPVRDSLMAKLAGCADGSGIEKGELLTKISGDTVDKWSLACLFYEMAVDNRIDFEELVKVICQVKNVPYTLPSAAE